MLLLETLSGRQVAGGGVAVNVSVVVLEPHLWCFVERLLRQYLYFCTSKASKLHTRVARDVAPSFVVHLYVVQNFALRVHVQRQYLYFCASKASKLSACGEVAVLCERLVNVGATDVSDKAFSDVH